MRTAEEDIYYSVKDHTVNSLAGAVSLIGCVRYVVEHGIPGALVECGVYRGGNIEVMVKAMQMLGRGDRDIYAFDTFDGMPQPADIDVEFGVDPAAVMWEKYRDGDSLTGSHWMRGTIYEVMDRVFPLGYPKERLHFVKGMVEDTLPTLAPEQVAVARFDTDFYSSTKAEFEYLYPRVSPGGVIIIDDYGAFQGSKLATDEYLKDNGIDVTLQIVDKNIRAFQKPLG